MSKVIAITGGIGSGKTTVSDYYIQQGFTVLKGDDIAKSVMSNNKKVKNDLITEFGEECFTDDNLNTKFIAEIVFNDSQELAKLNSIVHPETIKKISFDTEKLKRKEKIIFVEAAVLYEAKWEKYFDYVLLVTADEEIRIKRVTDRNNSSSEEVQERMKNQIDEEIKKSKADFVLENNGSMNDLIEKANFFLNLFKNLP